MNQRPLRIGLALFFLSLIAILSVQLYNREEPLHCTIKDRRAWQEKQRMQEAIDKQVRDSLNRKSQ